MTPRELFQSDDLSWLQKPDAEVESSSVERKRWADKKEVARQLSAFANSSIDGGLLVLVADKDGQIPGAEDRSIDNLLAGMANAIDSCRYEHRSAKAPNGRTVLMFFVPYSADRLICTSDGSAFTRRGHSTIELNDTEKRELRFTRGEESFEDLPAAAWDPELIDQQLLESYLDARRRKNGLTLDLSVEEALRTRNLLVGTPRGLMLTNAGVLAFGKNPFALLPGARLRLLRFDGVTEKFGSERNVTKDRWFEGPIPQIVANSREFIRTLVREFDHLGPNGLFVTEPEYPEPTWDEAIVNALVHRSYSLSNAAVFVRIFDDRMEVESPGGFPGPARERESHPRNPHLMDALRYFDLVRLTREGTRRMAEEMRKLDLPPPEFSEPTGFSVLVVLRNDLERRRQHRGASEVREQWARIAKLLLEPLAIYRRQGLWLWEELRKSNAIPPDAVLTAGVEILMNTDLSEEQRQPLIEPLRRSAANLPEAALDALVTAYTDGRFASTPNLEGQISLILRDSPSAREQLIRWLESSPALESEQNPLATRTDLALLALQHDLNVQQLPPPDRIERILAILRKHAAARTAQRLYEDITGHPLTK